MSLLNVVVVLLTLMILAPSQTVSATASAQAPQKQNILLILDADSETSLNTGMMLIQDMDFIPGSFVTALSTDRIEPLLKNQLAPFPKDVKADLSGKRFNSEMTRRLELSKLATIYNGHFNNEKPTHIVAEVCVILTTHRHIEGDTTLLAQLRRKKTSIVAIGFQKQAFSAVWSSLAANAEHVMELNNAANNNALMNRIRILISKDCRHGCDTDMFRPHKDKTCWDTCASVCCTNTLTNALDRPCVVNCPYYKLINTSELKTNSRKINEQPREAKKEEPNNIIIFSVLVGIAAVVIIFLFIGFCNKTVNLAVRSTYQKALRFWKSYLTQEEQYQDETEPLNIGGYGGKNPPNKDHQVFIDEPEVHEDPFQEHPHVPEENPPIPVGHPHVPEENPQIPVENPHVPRENPHVPVENPPVQEENHPVPVENPHVPEENPPVPKETPIGQNEPHPIQVEHPNVPNKTPIGQKEPHPIQVEHPNVPKETPIGQKEPHRIQVEHPNVPKETPVGQKEPHPEPVGVPTELDDIAKLLQKQNRVLSDDGMHAIDTRLSNESLTQIA